MLYVARTFDMFTETSNVANRCILSAIVDQNEIGKTQIDDPQPIQQKKKSFL